jgi:hypothetical protein
LRSFHNSHDVRANKESNPFLLLGKQARRSCFHQARMLADGGGICTPMAWQIWNHASRAKGQVQSK